MIIFFVLFKINNTNDIYHIYDYNKFFISEKKNDL